MTLLMCLLATMKLKSHFRLSYVLCNVFLPLNCFLREHLQYKPSSLPKYLPQFVYESHLTLNIIHPVLFSLMWQTNNLSQGCLKSDKMSAQKVYFHISSKQLRFSCD